MLRLPLEIIRTIVHMGGVTLWEKLNSCTELQEICKNPYIYDSFLLRKKTVRLVKIKSRNKMESTMCKAVGIIEDKQKFISFLAENGCTQFIDFYVRRSRSGFNLIKPIHVRKAIENGKIECAKYLMNNVQNEILDLDIWQKYAICNENVLAVESYLKLDLGWTKNDCIEVLKKWRKNSAYSLQLYLTNLELAELRNHKNSETNWQFYFSFLCGSVTMIKRFVSIGYKLDKTCMDIAIISNKIHCLEYMIENGETFDHISYYVVASCAFVSQNIYDFIIDHSLPEVWYESIPFIVQFDHCKILQQLECKGVDIFQPHYLEMAIYYRAINCATYISKKCSCRRVNILPPDWNLSTETFDFIRCALDAGIAIPICEYDLLFQIAQCNKTVFLGMLKSCKYRFPLLNYIIGNRKMYEMAEEYFNSI